MAWANLVRANLAGLIWDGLIWLVTTYHIYILHYSIIFFNFLFQFGLLQVPNHFHYIGNQSQIKSCWKNKNTTNQKLRWWYNDENKKCVQSQILVCLDATKLWRFLKKFLCGKYDNIKWHVWQKTQVKKNSSDHPKFVFLFPRMWVCAREGLTTYFTFMKKPINAKVLFEKEEENFLGGV